MTWVKVCGLRDRAGVEAAVRAGADAVGFVTDPASPRFVPPGDVAALAGGVPVLTVLVTVDMEAAALVAAASAAGVGGVQPHGRGASAAARAAEEAGLFVLRPIPVAATAVDVSAIPAGQMPLLDTAKAGRHGGTGEAFDWALAAGLGRDVVVAGGLGPGNVAAAIRAAAPWGVDASSGLESAPGVKDHGKIIEFVEEAKRA